MLAAPDRCPAGRRSPARPVRRREERRATADAGGVGWLAGPFFPFTFDPWRVDGVLMPFFLEIFFQV